LDAYIMVSENAETSINNLHDFTPAVGLTNPNLQTIFSSAIRKIIIPRTEAKFLDAGQEEIINLGSVRLQIERDKPANTEPLGLIMIIPGWLGHSKSSYVVSLAKKLVDARFEVVRITLRDHGETCHLNSGLFHSAETQEVVDLIKKLVDDFKVRYPNREGDLTTGLVGFSMGGNFALRVARQLSSVRTLAISPSLSPHKTIQKIENSQIYRPYFINKWRKIFRDKQRHFPDLYDFSYAMKQKSIITLTKHFIGEFTSFDSVDSYCDAYDLCGSRLEGVNAHILASLDDPVVPTSDIDALPPSVTRKMTKRGGHTAFIENWALESWSDSYAERFFAG
tara:strand:- start:779 stop:1789 length:1011 start_codon:yes stop_codon:yes gene_type:complete